MIQTDVVALCRIIAAACPSQKFDQYTPDVWAEVLADLDADDAKAAVLAAVKKQNYVSCADIVTGVTQIRRRRLEAFGDIGRAPDEILSDETNPRAWIEWENDRREAVLSGRLTLANDTHPKQLMPQYRTVGGAWWEN